MGRFLTQCSKVQISSLRRRERGYTYIFQAHTNSNV